MSFRTCDEGWFDFPPWLATVGFLLGLLATAWPAHGEAPTVRLGDVVLDPYALLQLDAGGTFGQSASGGQGSGFNARRGRLGLEGTVSDQLDFGVIWDFGGPPGDHSRLFEADVAYHGLDPFVIRAGVFKPAFTLEYAQSAADILFLERASIVDIVGGLVAGADRVGGQIGAGGKRWFAAALLTGGQTGPGARSDQRAALARAAGLVIKTDDLAMHVGVSGAWLYRVPRSDGDEHTLTFSDQPELQVDNVDPSLSTGSISASGAKLGGVELGLGWNRLWLQGEWYGIAVDGGSAGRDVFFSGWYGQAAYTVLGSPRQWKAKTASWGSPSVSNGFDPAAGFWGAVEVGARFSTVDLNDADVRGGEQRVWTAGVSWYPREHLRLILEYQHAAVTGGEAPRSLDAVAVRGQFSF